MAGCDEESANFPHATEGSKKRRAREFEQCLAKDEQETSNDFGKPLSSEFMTPVKDKVDKCAQSDPPSGVNGKPTETPIDDTQDLSFIAEEEEDEEDTVDLSFIDDLAKLMNSSEDWIKERKQGYMERVALSKRINDLFEECLEGMLEEDPDYDSDEREAWVEEMNKEVWREHRAKLALSAAERRKI